MKEIRYETNDITCECYTKCDNRPKVYVGSIACELCPHFLHNNIDEYVVKCDYHGVTKHETK